MNSDSESTRSSFINYNERSCKNLFMSVIQNMDLINQDMLQVERNLKHIVKGSGDLEKQLSVLLQSLPKPDIDFNKPN